MALCLLNKVVMKARIQEYINQFTEVHNGEPWFGESLSAILETISPEQAVAKAPGKSNIIRLLWHCVKWRQSLIECLKGTPGYRAKVEDADNWLGYDDPKMRDWPAAKARFEDQFAEIITLLKTKDDSLLEQEFHAGRTYKTLIEGVLQHDIYHFGQISLLVSIGG